MRGRPHTAPPLPLSRAGPYYNKPQPPPCATGPNKQPPSFAGQPALPLYHSMSPNCSNASAETCNGIIVQQPVVENDLASNYGAFATDFIAAHQPGAAPFFLCVGVTMRAKGDFCVRVVKSS